MLEQLREYKLNSYPYNAPFNLEKGSAINWWYTCESESGYDYLQELAIKIFSIIPHSANCERSFSTLGWYFSKTRQRLNITTLEDMIKLHSYYTSHTKSELQFVGQRVSGNELKKMVSDANLWSDEDEDDSDFEFGSNDLELENNEEYYNYNDNDFDDSLNIETFINLENEILNTFNNIENTINDKSGNCNYNSIGLVNKFFEKNSEILEVHTINSDEEIDLDEAIDSYENDEDTSNEDNEDTSDEDNEKSEGEADEERNHEMICGDTNDYEINDIDSGYGYGESDVDDENQNEKNPIRNKKKSLENRLEKKSFEFRKKIRINYKI